MPSNINFSGLDEETCRIAKLIDIALTRNMISGGEVAGKILWRMAGGNRTRAIEIAKNITEKTYTTTPVFMDDDFEYAFDHVMAQWIGGGVEVEWNETQQTNQ